jgi:hypothetical protein
MQVKIRKTNSCDGKHAFEWRPENFASGRWYSLNYETIFAAETIEGGLVRGETLFALGQGLTVVTHAFYRREAHQLTVLEPKGSD